MFITVSRLLDHKLASQQKLTKQLKMQWLSPFRHLPNHAGDLGFHWAQRAFTLPAMNVKLFTFHFQFIPLVEQKEKNLCLTANFKVDFISLLTFIQMISFYYSAKTGFRDSAQLPFDMVKFTSVCTSIWTSHFFLTLGSPDVGSTKSNISFWINRKPNSQLKSFVL